MFDADTLATIAQLGVGLAGFSGIALVLTRGGAELTRLESDRLAIMLGSSLGATFLGLLPLVLATVEPRADLQCRMASGIMAAYTVGFLRFYVIRTWRMRAQAPEIVHPAPFGLVIAGHSANVVLQIVALAQVVACTPAYMIGLFWMLFHGAYQFGRILFIQPRTPDVGMNGTATDIRKTNEHSTHRRMKSWFSPKTERRDSAIEGRGLFAVAAIDAGEIIAVKGGAIIDAATLQRISAEVSPAEIQIEDDLYIAPLHADQVEENMLRLNHSCSPNVGVRGQVTFVAMRDIAAGAELTIDYAMIDGDPAERMDCACGAPACRRVITGNDWQRPELQQRYAGYFSRYLQERVERENRA